MSGKLITFEGIEGSGKTTQARILGDWFNVHKRAFLATREPGGTQLGDRMRRLLLNPENHEMTPLTELFLYMAQRAQHVQQVIIPALEEGKIVLCDRFSDATLAYQGGGRGLSLEMVRRLCTDAAQGLKPQVTFLIDCPVEVGLGRARTRYHAKEGTSKGDRIEQEDMSFHERVRDAYLQLAQQEPTRFVVLDGTSDVDTLQQRIVREIERFIES